jgi:hypothetical protein
MKIVNALLICLLTFQFSWAQTAAEATQGSYSLKERYGIMKSKSQSFKEYKVIKESVLDGVWKIIQDTLRAKEVALQEANQSIAGLKGDVQKAELAVKQKDESVKEIIHDSTHITVAGIAFHKGGFVTGVAIVLGGLIFFLSVLFTRTKLLSKSLHEKKLAVNMVTHEFEDYKRKAMEKQTKLSRELQDERNKLQSLRNS